MCLHIRQTTRQWSQKRTTKPNELISGRELEPHYANIYKYTNTLRKSDAIIKIVYSKLRHVKTSPRRMKEFRHYTQSAIAWANAIDMRVCLWIWEWIWIDLCAEKWPTFHAMIIRSWLFRLIPFSERDLFDFSNADYCTNRTHNSWSCFMNLSPQDARVRGRERKEWSAHPCAGQKEQPVGGKRQMHNYVGAAGWKTPVASDVQRMRPKPSSSNTTTTTTTTITIII